MKILQISVYDCNLLCRTGSWTEKGQEISHPYWVGHTRGWDYADHVIETCTLKNHPFGKDFGFLKHYSVEYRQGFVNGYEDMILLHPNGTYGGPSSGYAKVCKLK